MAERFLNLTAWITGGGSGIGQALAMELARQGADVAVSGRRRDRLEAVVAEVEKLGRRGLAVVCDVTQEPEVQRAVGEIVGAWGKLDVVVANAGFSVSGPVAELSDDAWRRQYETNVFGLLHTVRHTVPELIKTRGRLALMGSVAGMIVGPRTGCYSSSKYAVRAIGQALAMELHPHGVSCTLLQPGFVQSEIAQVDNQGRFDPNRRDRRPTRLMWKANDAAVVMVRAVYRRRREAVITGHGKLGAWMGKHCPGLVHFLVTHSKAVSQGTERIQKARNG
jgi:NADP-dependent 3-hydroxy acid dehydrogenase YdfG